MDSSSRRTAANSRRAPLTDAASRVNSMAPKYLLAGKQSRTPPGVEPPPVPSLPITVTPKIAIQAPVESKRASTASEAAERHPIKRDIGNWQLGKDIGQGGSCLVRIVRNKASGQLGVAKIVNVATAEKVRARSLANLASRVEQEESDQDRFMKLPLGLEREVTILRVLNHKNVCKLYDVWQHFTEVYIILEYVEGGELFSYISQDKCREGGGMDEKDAIDVFRQILTGILYCHQFQIFHRDLKPENILYDPKRRLVTLIDFGMAAYQPHDHKLSTPCGSPHYAAPELLHGINYDGSKADVWSAGVILYALLLGDLPFNYPPNTPKDQQIHLLYDQIKRAEYKLPDALTPEAKSLFKRIFQPDPEKRIKMSRLWEHPYLHKYDEELGLKGQTLRDALGEPPVVDNWQPLTPGTINRSILRSLETLWHDATKAKIIKRLCSTKPNIEQYFYQKLMSSYLENLENLDTAFERTGFVPSASDYHHLHLPHGVRSVTGKRHHRSTSKFSIYNEEHLVSQHSFFNDDIKPVLDTSSITTKQTTKGSKRHSMAAKPNRSTSRLSINSNHSRSVSRASTISVSRRSPSLLVPIRRHKHKVSFHHNRPAAPEIPRVDSPCLPSSSGPSILQVPATASLNPGNSQHISKKRTYLPKSFEDPKVRVLKQINTEARKVSNELALACQTAFFGSSDDSSEKSSVTNAVARLPETPPSSISNGSAHANITAFIKFDRSILDRPLPPAPVTADLSPNGQVTRFTRQIEELKHQLIQTYPQTQNMGEIQRHMDELLNKLDVAISRQARSERLGVKSHNIGQSFLDSTEFLQAIPEETQGKGSSDLISGSNSTVLRYDASTTDFAIGSTQTTPYQVGLSTIRYVNPSSPMTPPLPLNIRQFSDNIDHSTLRLSPDTPGKVYSRVPLSSIAKPNHEEKPKAKKRWFRRLSQMKFTSEKFEATSKPTSPDFYKLDDRITRRNERLGGSPSRLSSNSDTILASTPTKQYRESNLRQTSHRGGDTLLDATYLTTGFEGDGRIRESRLKKWLKKREVPDYEVQSK
jgi:serine/threonine-protein kinase HSL1 (negative regulator of Swe1 kinase)